MFQFAFVQYDTQPGTIRQAHLKILVRQGRLDQIIDQNLRTEMFAAPVECRQGGESLFEDEAIQRYLLRNEPLVAAVPSGHRLLAAPGGLALANLARETLIIYPKAPRPSYADQVLSIFRDRGLKPVAVHEVRELQTALGLVAAETGVCLVPVSVTRLRRDNVAYRDLDDPTAISPNIISCRKNDTSTDLACILNLLADIYAEQKIAFGR